MSIQTQISRISGAVSAALTALTKKGVTVPSGTKVDSLASLIENISTGTDTSDATAAAGDILSGKTAYAKGVKVTGTIQSQAAQTITPSTSDKTIAAGKYLSGKQTIKGDANLVAENIKSGVSIFGVNGTLESGGGGSGGSMETCTVTFYDMFGFEPLIAYISSDSGQVEFLGDIQYAEPYTVNTYKNTTLCIYCIAASADGPSYSGMSVDCSGAEWTWYGVYYRLCLEFTLTDDTVYISLTDDFGNDWM